MDEIMKSINDCNFIRYASYRTASKIQIIHKELNMQHIHVELIAAIFEKHKFSVTENSVNLDILEIEDVLSDIYFVSKKESGVDFDVDNTIKLALSFIFKAFDKKEDENISVISFKVALTLISCGRLEEKYGYLFHQLADHNACLSKASLNTLLTNICNITEVLGETVAYGKHLIRKSIDDCFSESQGCLGVTEAQFASWLIQEPPLLMWITTLVRMKSAESIVHNVKCSSCKSSTICGPRYLCLRCHSYNQCQICFLNGKISGKHKLKHPVREYCIKTSNKEISKILELIRNKLLLCPSTDENNSIDNSFGFNLEQSNNFDSVSVRSTIKRRVLNDPQKELQSIINHIEEENRQLQLELKRICGNQVEKLKHHKVAIESQLERLKTLKNYLFPHDVKLSDNEGEKKNQKPHNSSIIQSTPMVQPTVSKILSLPMAFELSPIIHCSNSDYPNSRQIAINDTKNGSNINERVTELSRSWLSESNCSKIEPSTWIGGHRTSLKSTNSNFSQWLNSKSDKKDSENSSKINDRKYELGTTNTESNRFLDPKVKENSKYSCTNSLQNIQGDLNDILDRLQNMVANDCLLEDTFNADNNCELKRAAAEMEDLLTGLIEGMESRRSKLTTIV